MYNTVKSGEAEIQTSSHSSRSGKIDIPSRPPIIDNEAALKIIEDLNTSDMLIESNDVKSKVKPIFTNIAAPSERKNTERKSDYNNNNSTRVSSNIWRKLTITTGEFVYP
jgi:hypothetical protein